MQRAPVRRRNRAAAGTADAERRRHVACANAQNCEVYRTRHVLTPAELSRARKRLAPDFQILSVASPSRASQPFPAEVADSNLRHTSGQRPRSERKRLKKFPRILMLLHVVGRCPSCRRLGFVGAPGLSTRASTRAALVLAQKTALRKPACWPAPLHGHPCSMQPPVRSSMSCNSPWKLALME